MASTFLGFLLPTHIYNGGRITLKLIVVYEIKAIPGETAIDVFYDIKR